MNVSTPNLPSLRVPPESSDGVEIRDLLRVLWRRRLVIAVAFVGAFALGLWVLSDLATRYTSEAVLILEVAKREPVDVESVVAGLNKDTALIKSEMDVLRSRGLAEQVVDELGLMADPEFNAFLRPVQPGFLERTGIIDLLPRPLQGWLGEEQQDAEDVPPERVRAMVVNHTLSNLRVENDDDSYTVRLSFESGSATVAAAVANAFADLYLTNRLQGKYEATDRAAQWVHGNLDRLRRQVTAADQAVQDFREQHQIIDVADSPLIDRQLAEVSTELALAAVTRGRLESALQEVRKAESAAGRFAVSQIASAPLVQQLRSLQNELLAHLAELRAEFGPRHTRIVETESKLGEVQDRLEQEVHRVLDELESNVLVARAQERALSAELEELKAKRETADRATIKLRQLTSEADAARAMFDAFVQGFSRTSAAVGVSEPDVRILSRAVAPLAPSFPPRTLLMLLTALVAALLALLAAAVLELMDSGYRNPADFERAHGMPVLGLIPLTYLRGSGQQHPSMEVVERPLSRFTEAVQSVCTSLDSAHADQPQTVLVTSAVPDEGKTAFAIALGRVAACNGKRVLLIDCDLRRPSISRDLGQSCEHGLVELFDHRAGIEDVLHVDELSGMAFVPARGNVAFPAEIFRSDLVQRFIEGARREFDLIILDSPPVGIISDALMLAGMADATLLTVRWGKTPRSAVATAVKKLAAGHRPATAAVFSHVDLRRCAAYGYYPAASSERYFADLEDRWRTTARV